MRKTRKYLRKRLWQALYKIAKKRFFAGPYLGDNFPTSEYRLADFSTPAGSKKPRTIRQKPIKRSDVIK